MEAASLSEQTVNANPKAAQDQQREPFSGQRTCCQPKERNLQPKVQSQLRRRERCQLKKGKLQPNPAPDQAAQTETRSRAKPWE